MFKFTKIAEKKLYKISSSNREMILIKLKNIKSGKILGDFCKLQNFGEASHRLRIGDYRLILKEDNGSFIVLDIGHRQSIYK